MNSHRVRTFKHLHTLLNRADLSLRTPGVHLRLSTSGLKQPSPSYDPTPVTSVTCVSSPNGVSLNTNHEPSKQHLYSVQT